MRTVEFAAVAAEAFSFGLYITLSIAFHVLLRRGRARGWVLSGGDILRRRSAAAECGAFEPRLVSILKPLAGEDDDLAANLDSFARIKRVPYEIVLGVASPSDPALRAARAFLARHPDVDARIVLTDPDAALNPKVAQLIGLAKVAHGDVVVVSDSNVRVDKAYLEHLVRPFADPRCGVVQSLFAGVGERSLGAAVENLQLGAVITPFVVLSTLGPTATVGKSMAFRRADLDALGGFAPFGNVLAEDLTMGRAVLKRGRRIATSFHQIENRVVTGSLAKTFDRHSRWAKMRRSIAPTAFALELFMSPFLVAGVALAIAPSRGTLLMLLVAAIVQTGFSFASLRAIRGKALPLWLLPLETVRVFVMLATWASAWASRRAVWRGNSLLIGPGSVLSGATAPPAERTRPATAGSAPR